YAPWCPACQQIELTWESFAKESERLDITVGKVDVTQEPGLSGRFFVTTLPTIYHANDGVFRRYRGSRTLEDLQGYVLERKWEAVEPVAGWKSPSSIVMHGMAGLFHLSGWIRQIHSYLTGILGIHVWISYAIFILATLLIGLFLGL
ncbi:TMX4 protein, partial [Spizaetus tyrannus]|nr:TMX4 protein [Spizaetus tyrannus]